MNETRIKQILNLFPELKVLVVGDFFLDDYLIMDRNLSEVSLETGLEAYQVIETRKSPGAAGTVTSNLRALDVNVVALSVTGDDGNGYDLRRKLENMDVDIHALLQHSDLFTPTYTKPMMREPDGKEHELNRMDIKNRAHLPVEIENAIIEHLHEIIPHVQGVLIIDQVQEHNCGVITDKVREEIQKLAKAYPQKFFIVDSREHANLFSEVILKTNLSESIRAAGIKEQIAEDDLKKIHECCTKLFNRTHQPIIITRGEKGSIIFKNPETSLMEISSFPVTGPIDIVGAGDSVSASMGSALCAGAALEEAALIGNLTASIVIQQIGTTGTASRDGIIERYREFEALSKS